MELKQFFMEYPKAAIAFSGGVDSAYLLYAAVLKHFADRFGDMPVMKVTSIGYGMGRKDFERANCVRVLLGQTADTPYGQIRRKVSSDYGVSRSKYEYEDLAKRPERIIGASQRS